MAGDLDPRKIHAACMQNLETHLAGVTYPQPESEQDLAAIICRAYLYGAAFVVQWGGGDKAAELLIAQATKFLQDRARQRGHGPKLLLPPGMMN